MSSYHFAQFNIARCRSPLDTPLMRDFVENLGRINLLAESSSGFVWRFATAEGNATAARVYEDPMVIANLSVWKSPEALKAYAYRSEHVQIFKRRKEWFHELDGPSLVLWWIPADTLPSLEEGRRRLELLATKGPSPEAFTFQSVYSPQTTLATDKIESR